MSTWTSLRESLVGPSQRSMGSRSRARRWQMVGEVFPSLADMRVIDLGGTAASWSLSPVRPRHLTLVNPSGPNEQLPEGAEHVQADACALPATVLEQTWDLVFSNSVIEHVGGHRRCLEFANSVHSLANAHWIQTPYRYFPIEPHWVFPGFQFFPVRGRVAIAQLWPLHGGARTPRAAVSSEVLDIQLLSYSELATYFPNSRVMTERFLGLPKSLIAVRE